jgi:hypothetical protein
MFYSNSLRSEDSHQVSQVLEFSRDLVTLFREICAKCICFFNNLLKIFYHADVLLTKNAAVLLLFMTISVTFRRMIAVQYFLKNKRTKP